MLKFFCLSPAVLCFSLISEAQDADFSIKVVDYSSRLKSRTAFINVYSDNVFEGKHAVDTMGRVLLSLKTDHSYKIEACDSGKVSRYIIVKLSEENSGALMGIPVECSCQISLFSEEKGNDYKYILNNPITTFSYDTDKNELVFDEKKAREMADHVTKIMKKEESLEKK